METMIDNSLGRAIVSLNLTAMGRLLGIGLLLGLLSACGGSGGGDSFTGGGFVGQEEIKVNVSADRTTLPPVPNNTFVPFPNPTSDPYTTIVTVTVTLEGRPFTLPAASSLELAITRGLSHGSLVCPELSDGCSIDDDGDGVFDRQNRFRGIVGDATSDPVVGLNNGTFQFLFHANGDPDGTAVISATVNSPSLRQNVTDTVQIRVTEGVSTGDPAQITFNPAIPGGLYITGQGLAESLPFEINVFDDAFEPVDNPGGRNNLLLQILPNSPNGGETLSTIDANGQTQTGISVATRTLNGVAQASLSSGTLPGTVLILASADRFDNNVDNGIQEPITDVYTVSIGNGQPRTLTFTGPFVELINDNENVLVLGDGIELNDNVYTIPITVLAIDQFGNPPPTGTQITFRIVDSPLDGFPDEGRGEFVIGGDDGNIEEGGQRFTTPPGGSTFNGSQPGCQLVYEGDPPDQEGGRIITSVDTQRQLTVNTPFNSAPDTGFTVPYVVGCPPHAGSVGILGANQNTSFTDANGVATTDLIYDATQLGRRFKLVAEANGGQAGAVLSYWYLGIGDAVLSLFDENGVFIANSDNAAPQETIDIAVGGEESRDRIIRLTDANDLPLPAQLLSIEAQITDPDEELLAQAVLELQAAERQLQVAQEELDRFITEFPDACGIVEGPDPSQDPPPVCPDPQPSQVSCGPDPMNPDILIVTGNSVLGDLCPLPPEEGLICTESGSERCLLITTLQDNVTAAEDAVFTAETAVAQAQAIADEFDPVVQVNGTTLEDGDTVEVLTEANGEVLVSLHVSDLPPVRDETSAFGIPGVTFVITTVGPDPQAPSLEILFQVPDTVIGAGN